MLTLTVLMPVYNGDRYLRPAVDSILAQTFTDFEFLIIDNGSTDQTEVILNEYQKKDARIRVLHREKGLVEALNYGFDQSRGKYIARLDADDICLPNRMHKQVEFMEKHAEVGVCGSWIRCFGNYDQVTKHPVDDASLRAEMLFSPPFANSSTIIRQSVLKSHGIYFRNPPYSEDYDLWVRLSRVTHFANIPEILVNYRVYVEQTTQTHSQEMAQATLSIQKRQLTDLGITPTDQDIALHAKICGTDFVTEMQFLEAAEKWFLKLQNANIQYQVYPELEFKKVLGGKWWRLCYFARPGLIGRLLGSPISHWADISLMEKNMLVLKPLLRPLKNRLLKQVSE